MDALHRDGPALLFFAFGVLLVTAFLLFQEARSALIVAGTVGIAMLWLVGLMQFMGWRVDLFNLIAIPMIVGWVRTMPFICSTV